MTENSLRKVIRQVISESANTPEATPEEMINRYKSRPSDWNAGIKDQFIDMSKGGNGNLGLYNYDVRDYHYSNWEDDDFKKVLLAMMKIEIQPLIDEILELSQEEIDYIISEITKPQ